MDFKKKKLLYKMLVEYYLSNNMNALFEDFVLGLRNVWAGLDTLHAEFYVIKIYFV